MNRDSQDKRRLGRTEVLVAPDIANLIRLFGKVEIRLRHLIFDAMLPPVVAQRDRCCATVEEGHRNSPRRTCLRPRVYVIELGGAETLPPKPVLVDSYDF